MSDTNGFVGPQGSLALSLVPAVDNIRPEGQALPYHPARELSALEIVQYGAPQAGLHPLVNRWRRSNLRNLWRGARQVLLARKLNLTFPYGQLWMTLHSVEYGDLDLGLSSMRVVTTAGVNKIVAGLSASDTATFSIFKYHGIGTGSTAEAIGDTALVTELTTQYATDNTRPTGSQGTGATANVYRTSATITPDSGLPLAITEHGVFSAVTAGTLLDRSVFSAINLTTAGDAISAQYDLTCAAGG